MADSAILNKNERKFILLLGDLFIIGLALGLFINKAVDQENLDFFAKSILISLGFLFYLTYAYVLESYNIEKVSSNSGAAITKSVVTAILFSISIVVFAILLFDLGFWRKSLLLFLISTPLQFFIWRMFFESVFKIVHIEKKVFYIYDSETGRTLNSDINKINGEDFETFYNVAGTYSIEKNVSEFNEKFLAQKNDINTWIVNIRNYDDLPLNVEGRLLNAMIEGKELLTFTSFYENVYEALPIKSRNDSFYEMLHLQSKRIRYLQSMVSFVINFLFCFFISLVFLLVLPFVIILNLFFNRGPLFYTQYRVGKNGKEFKIFKFRSMVVNAEKAGAKMAQKNDARITAFGRILRRYRVDELPQILSIIRGDMQFIGPRPERKVFVDQLKATTPLYNVRHLIKPGITGWAQVKFKYGENLEDSIAKLEYDLFYIKNKSVIIDLKIIFKTVSTVLFSRGV
ncbi:sugar transferase [Poritiphilus flavus]|uniref:Exopolysaccharide biosynthesis protein n=1 Tax=Poritiphilus flavus TaxID=2697053 RepID=A0A6L9EAD4_9FLAO|nr:sugar transferase [Poritiphilus flavus]NAS11508.1 exopolysaccharide biosynthesis protein [Poritiphilus flavus]